MSKITEWFYEYIDDILIGGRTKEESENVFEETISHLQQSGLKIKSEKVQPVSPRVKLLGAQLTTDGISTLPERLAQLEPIPTPTGKKKLQRLIGQLKFL